MKIETPNEEGFKTCPHIFCGIDAFLTIPALDPKWNESNLHFRSLITDKVGNVLSCGHLKFFNLGEAHNWYPDPTRFSDIVAETKHDGSLLIMDFVNGHFSMRTRGCASYKVQPNWEDFEKIILYNPNIPKIIEEYSHISFLFEIESPNNIVVIHSNDIHFTFLGGIDKRTLKYIPRQEVKDLSKLMDINTPITYDYNDILSMAEMVKEWKGKEGLVISYNNNQSRVKLKSDWYLFIHKIKSQFNNINNLIEFYVNEGMPIYQTFYDTIKTHFDYELAELLVDQMTKISDAGESVRKTISNMHDFISSIRNFDTRKDQALAITRQHGGMDSGVLFSLLDGKELNKKQLIKLVESSLV